ncbi:MAG: hypothetical protein GY757_21555 [bacterium]|nr:hypothetical protein [bacterium]
MPRWVTTGVYAVITSKTLAENRGVLKLKTLTTLLNRVKTNDYLPHTHRYIVQLMRKFKLCFDIDRDTLLVPDQLTADEPPLEYPFDAPGTLRLEQHYEFLPRGVLPRVMVSMHRDIDGDLRWRSGMVLKDATFGSRAVIAGDVDRGLIRVFVSGGRKTQYLSVIRHAFRHIHDTFEKLGVSEKVPLPDKPGIAVGYEHLLRLRQRGQSDFLPDGAEKYYNVGLLLTGFEDPGTLHIAAEIERRLSVLDDLLRLCSDDKTKEIEIHTLLARNLWALGKGYDKLSSDESLKALLKKLKGKEYDGDDAARRPDLLLERVDKEHLLLVEFKRPSLKLKRVNEFQAINYRDTLENYFEGTRIDIVVMGGPTRADVSGVYKGEGVDYRSYHAVISLARHELEGWLSDISKESRAVISGVSHRRKEPP